MQSPKSIPTKFITTINRARASPRTFILIQRLTLYECSEEYLQILGSFFTTHSTYRITGCSVSTRRKLPVDVGSGGTYLLFSAILYVTYVRKRKKQYPQVLLDGYDDIYFPRTTIPRPLYRDIRKHQKYFEKNEDNQTQAQT